jgi:hypothetical protein
MKQLNDSIKLLEKTAEHFRMTLGPGTSSEDMELLEEIEKFLENREGG